MAQQTTIGILLPYLNAGYDMDVLSWRPCGGAAARRPPDRVLGHAARHPCLRARSRSDRWLDRRAQHSQPGRHPRSGADGGAAWWSSARCCPTWPAPRCCRIIAAACWRRCATSSIMGTSGSRLWATCGWTISASAMPAIRPPWPNAASRSIRSLVFGGAEYYGHGAQGVWRQPRGPANHRARVPVLGGRRRQ